MPREQYDVIVAGAGPAGLVTTALVAGRGHRVLLLERDPCPGFRGAEVRERSVAVNVVIENGRVTGLRHRPEQGPARTVRARYVVDASGGDSVLRRHVAGARSSSGLAVYACFEADGVQAGGPRRFPFGNGWFWIVPVGGGLTRVGAVVRPNLANRVHKDPEGALFGFAKECPPVRDFLARATWVRGGRHGQIRVRPHWSYATDRLWRPGMVLVGDAACSVASESLLSRGVHLACRGAGLAASALDGFLRGTTEEGAAFAEFGRRYREAYDEVMHSEIPHNSGPRLRCRVSHSCPPGQVSVGDEVLRRGPREFDERAERLRQDVRLR